VPEHAVKIILLWPPRLRQTYKLLTTNILQKENRFDCSECGHPLFGLRLSFSDPIGRLSKARIRAGAVLLASVLNGRTMKLITTTTFALFLSLFTRLFAQLPSATGLQGKWSAPVEAHGTKATLYYTFAVDGQKLTGDLQGPQGTVMLQNGTFKDSVFSFDIEGRSLLHQSGRFYGDSVTIDMKVRDESYHLLLKRVSPLLQ
jgi:hypothetical protein